MDRQMQPRRKKLSSFGALNIDYLNVQHIMCIG
jgi:hypothetical protein